MKILFADSVDAERVARLTEAGHECRLEPGLTADDLPEAIGDAEALVVRSTKVTAATIDAAPRLGLIVRAGAGTDNIDRDAASAAGVYVCNVPGRNAIAVAELTMALLLAIDRHISEGANDLRNGQWDKARYTKADGLAGKSMAIIGLGDIGLEVAARAKAFGITVSAIRKDDRSAETNSRIRSIGIRLVEDEDALLSTADIVSIHVPKADGTVGLVDAEFLAKLPDGAIVLNTSRGEVVDEAALIDAMDKRGIRAGLDVYRNEPGEATGTFVSELAQHPSVVGSHHIGASTTQAQESVADGTLEVLDAYGRGEILNSVNLVTEARGSSSLIIRHLNQVGVLARILNLLGASGHNVEQMENQVFSGGVAAVATINVEGHPSHDVIQQIEQLEPVLAVSTAAAVEV